MGRDTQIVGVGLGTVIIMGNRKIDFGVQVGKAGNALQHKTPVLQYKQVDRSHRLLRAGGDFQNPVIQGGKGGLISWW